jgi:hypothetical protein
MPIPASSSTGTLSHHSPRRLCGLGRASRSTAITEPIPREAV